MADISTSDDAPVIIDKHTKHHVRQLLLGTVIGAHWGDSGHLVLYYADGHKTLFRVDAEGDIVVAEYEVPEC